MRSRPEREPAEGVRRYALGADRDGVWSRHAVEQRAWAATIGAAKSTHLSQVEDWIDWQGRPGLVERFPPGLRLGRALLAPGVGRTCPLAARVLILAHLARGLELRGYHGGIRRDAVHLGFDGRAILLVPPPPGARRIPDGPALARLGLEDLRLEGAKEVARTLAAWTRATRGCKPSAAAVFAAAHLDGLDPSRAVLGRWVRAAAAALPPPVLSASAVDGPAGSWDSLPP